MKLTEMTAKELRKEIEKRADIINERMKQYYGDGNDNVLVNNEINVLKHLGGRVKAGQYVGKAKSRASKTELKRYLSELGYFTRWDIYSEDGQAEIEKREKEAYESFKERYREEDYSYQEWRKLVEAFGAIGSDIVTQFGSDNIKQAYDDATDDKAKDNLINIMRDILKSTNGSVDDLKDRLRDRLGAK